MVATLAGTPTLSRLKSILRYCRRPSPPRWRTVMRPWLLRPELEGSFSSRDFSGSAAVISSKLEVAMKRRPGLVGLYFLTAISLLHRPEQAFQLLAGAEGDDGLLPIRGIARDAAAPAAPRLAAHVHRVDRDHRDALRRVVLLERSRDLGLAGVAGDAERVATELVERVGALGDHRAQHDLVGGFHEKFSSS